MPPDRPTKPVAPTGPKDQRSEAAGSSSRPARSARNRVHGPPVEPSPGARSASLPNDLPAVRSARTRRSSVAPGPAPLHAELFSISQLERHGARLAKTHSLGPRRADMLLPRLADNARVLGLAYALLSDALQRGRHITPAAEWLVDNYHVLEEQTRLARQHLPAGYSRALPRLEDGTPRVYALALELISHSHGRIDADSLHAFIAAYQRTTELTLGELWAIPIMLRLALLENLRRVVAGITDGRHQREQAARWAGRLLDVAVGDPTQVVVELAALVAEDPPLTNAFVAELANQLQGQGAVAVFTLGWLEQRIGERGHTIDHAIQLTSQAQAADQLTMGNSIGSLRLLTATDWRVFVEEQSVVEKVLRGDPSGHYAAMDFTTRDRYRHVVEELARRGGIDERTVAARAIELAEAQPTDGDPRRRHVGWFLIDDGRRVLARALKAQPHAHLLTREVAHRLRLPLYVGTIAVLAALAVVAATLGATTTALGTAGMIAWATTLALCSSQLAISLVQWATTLMVPPRVLPRLDFSSGIPEAQRTLVAVPSLITSDAVIDELVSALEIRYLTNRDRNLGFALIGDFGDADQAELPGDAPLVAHATAAINALNARYPDDGGFFLLHRNRRWNSADHVWMGWERKRGKLEDLNEFLRGDATRFATVVGPTERLTGVSAVIVLDSDTGLPRDTARELIGTLTHPLNRPRFDAQRERVVDGYAILQPRIGITLMSAASSRFARLFAGDCGIDPYTRAVSNVYQDVFGEGSFVGKGIYDVDAVRTAMGGRFPDNRVLSHDLLEGAYGRAGLVSDVTLFEDHPTSHGVDASRRARWIRGDWQIARWLWRRVPGGDAGAVRNPASWLSRWKIFDNLRRSLVAPAMLAALAIGWLVPGTRFATLLIVLATAFLPGIFASAAALVRPPREAALGRHVRDVVHAMMRAFLREAFALATLPYEAWLSVDAIGRVVVRLSITGRKLLEWRTAADAARSSRTDFVAVQRAMWIGPLTAIVAGAAVALRAPTSLPFALPFLVSWALSPTVTWWLSQPLRHATTTLTQADRNFLRLLARRTWRFFEDHVTEEDQWLAPDNVQIDPPVGVAHRTSPTNIGLSLLANLAAWDLGHATVGEVVTRTTNTLATLDRMQRFRGHFYNWYDTRTLEPLRPMYVSAVDSGNLAGHLLVLAAGLDELGTQPIVRAETFAGLGDVVALLAEQGVDEAALTPIRKITDAPPPTLLAARDALAQVAALSRALATQLAERQDLELDAWVSALVAQAESAHAELAQLAPWLTLGVAPKGVPARLARLVDNVVTLAEVWELVDALAPEFATAEAANLDGDNKRWVLGVQAALSAAKHDAGERLAGIASLASRAREFADLDYDLLYDHERKLLAIGYNVSDRRLDASFYDLLASEARLASYVAIAQGKLPEEHWFHLGRALTTTGGETTLLSWSGSMFEYLMPLLVMPTFAGTLLDSTYHASVARQIAYGRERDVPWGISESGYYKTDAYLNYQYRAFGVPGLGFKRGLGDDLVIAPYAAAMAAMIDPAAATANLRRLRAEDRQGPLGMFEAVDYTANRLPPGKDSATVASYMAHHQGMTLLALDYVVADQPMQRRFLLDPALRATELVLQERIPRTVAVHPHPAEISATRAAAIDAESDVRVIATPSPDSPEVHLLSNGNYHVMVSAAGGGYSQWNDFAVTRWREDGTRDPWGTFAYLRDVDSGAFWSAAYQPTTVVPDRYEAVFSQGRAEFRRLDDGLDTHVEISVCPEDDIELRRITITNLGVHTRHIDLTTYAEVVLAPAAADTAHRAFSNLFVQTELVPERHAILATRRPRSAGEVPPWLVHLVNVDGVATTATSYETDRLEFLGRGRTPADPRAMREPVLGGGHGSVLDPIVAIRTAVTLRPDQSAVFHVLTGVAETRLGALALAEKYADRHLSDRVIELAWTQSQVLQRQLDATPAELRLWQRLAGRVLYLDPALRASRQVIASNMLGQSALWAYGISGDLPIVLVRISSSDHLDIARQLVRAHGFWRRRGLLADLVIWNEDPSGYRQELQEQLVNLITTHGDAALVDRPGGVFLRRADQIAVADRVLMQSLARIIIDDTAGAINEQLERRQRHAAPLPGPPPTPRPTAALPSVPARSDLVGWNGHGGFTQDGREYVIVTHRDAPTPAPWSNVLANPYFGTVVSESGAAYTWCENAHSYRLTPWTNDPVSDGSGETLYLRDDAGGHAWSPTPFPAPGNGTYTTRHGFGYSIFETEEDGIATTLRTFVATNAPVKFVMLTLRNNSGRARKLSLLACHDLVLGAQRPATAAHIVSEVDVMTGALFARNPYADEFAARVAFLECSESRRFVSGDRLEVLGRNGHPSHPAALGTDRLSGRVGARLDPCLAMQVPLDLADGQEREVVFLLGSGRDLADARQIVGRYRGVAAAQTALEEVWEYWNRTLGTLHVQTPDPTLDYLANGWLIYQVIAARMWGRSGFYQSGGAFGFRDQLQDSAALVHAEPRLLRAQLVRAAAHQFPEGDVQHWWHPPSGRGVRTRISDDYLWLPYIASRYVAMIGDTGVLDEEVEFIEGRKVNLDEESYYDLPVRSTTSATLYEHCKRAIGNGLRMGVHGLPLMGTGDWNDGMNLVGHDGRGESVWLGFFLHDVLTQFVPVARGRGDDAYADECIAHAATLSQALETAGWDGAWYRRAYFDDGTPLGSSTSPECQIDSLPQSWAMLTGVGDPDRARQGLEALDARLVDRELGVIKLFDPPFDTSNLDPGYVKGYVPGVRENGGQYTHAAVWAVMAFAAAGNTERAWELFDLINPLRHGNDPERIATYMVEPYVVAADVYTNPSHAGRGGWTWYTGSAGWMYRLITESLLGIRIEVDRLHVTPRLPAAWPGFTVHYRHHETIHHIEVKRVGPGEVVQRVLFDGVVQPDGVVPLRDDMRAHQAVVEVG